MKIAAIDNGYWATKVYTKAKQFSFRSKYEKASDMLNPNNTMSLFYEGTNYIVGEGATMSNVDYDKTSNELHKICTYAALSSLSSRYGTDFCIVVGYPLNVYISGAESFSNYLLTKSYVNTKLDGEEKTFRIIDCTVFPQCAGAAYVYPERFKNRLVGILDIGGLTVNGCIFDNLNLIRESIFTENLGSIILNNKIKKALEIRYGMNIQDYEIPGIIKNGLRKYPEESAAIIKEVMMNHVEEIKRVAKVNKWNVDNLDIMFIGGTSITLYDQLKKLFPNGELSDDPVNDNAKGFYKVGEMIYEKDF